MCGAQKRDEFAHEKHIFQRLVMTKIQHLRENLRGGFYLFHRAIIAFFCLIFASAAAFFRVGIFRNFCRLRIFFVALFRVAIFRAFATSFRVAFCKALAVLFCLMVAAFFSLAVSACGNKGDPSYNVKDENGSVIQKYPYKKLY